MVGQTCWGTFCYGGTEQTIYKAQGSNDDLGADANTENTLYQDPNGSFYLIDPETCPLELEDPNYVGFAYFHNDHLGTPRVVTAEDGATLWKGDYNPFGKVKETLAEGVVFEQDIRFPGQVEDRETGLYYNYYRYYQADLGRYLTSDPIGLRGGLNTYAYVGGNPIMLIDPFGLYEWGGHRRSLSDGPRYGNWCGKNWCGGVQPSLNMGMMGNAAPVDDLDEQCKKHDYCYENCKNYYSNSKFCKDYCDSQFVNDLYSLPTDPKNWKKPPHNLHDAYKMREEAIKWFQ